MQLNARFFCSGGRDTEILFLAGAGGCDAGSCTLNFPPGVGGGVLINCQHRLCRNRYLCLSFASVNNRVHTTLLHWTQIAVINAASINMLLKNFILVIFLKKNSFYFCKIIGEGNYLQFLLETFVKKNLTQYLT